MDDKTGYDGDDPACLAVARDVQRKEQKEVDAAAAEYEREKARSPWWVVSLRVGLGTAKTYGRCGKSAYDPMQYAAWEQSFSGVRCQIDNDPVNGVVVVECVYSYGRHDAVVFTLSEAACHAVWARFQ